MTRLYINPINNLNHMSQKRVYTFGNGLAEGKADMRNLLGGKGANLAEMNLIGVPVPPGFTITTDVCNEYYEVVSSTSLGTEGHRAAGTSEKEAPSTRMVT